MDWSWCSRTYGSKHSELVHRISDVIVVFQTFFGNDFHVPKYENQFGVT